MNPLSIVVYAGCVFVYLWAGLFNWTAAHKGSALADDLPEQDYRRMRRRQLRGCFAVTAIFAITLVQLAMK